MKKTYVLDTNVLISDPNCFNNFKDNDLIVPILVLEEIDNHKTRTDEVGRACREINRRLDEMSKMGDLQKGVATPGGGKLFIKFSDCNAMDLLPAELKQGSSVDNMIIAFVLHLRSKLKSVVLVSKDINVRIKSQSLGIPAEDYLSIKVSDNVESLYTGVRVAQVHSSVIDDFYKGGAYTGEDLQLGDRYPNQIVVLKSTDEEGNTIGSALSRLDEHDTLVPLEKYENVFGVKCRNKEQIFSIDLLMNPDIKLVTLTGRAGCGKTLLALAAGLEQLQTIGGKNQLYQKLIVSRPVQPVGRDIGFLPGTLEEKMEPWIAPIRDNLEFLLGSRMGNKLHNKRKKSDDASGGFRDPYLELMQQKGLIEIEAISFIRGRSIPNSFIIIDEAQNLSMHELKTIITRVGEGTKIVLTGDIEQIDNVHVDTFTNGLTYAIEKFKSHSIAAHVSLIKGERSALATLASQIL